MKTKFLRLVILLLVPVSGCQKNDLELKSYKPVSSSQEVNLPITAVAISVDRPSALTPPITKHRFIGMIVSRENNITYACYEYKKKLYLLRGNKTYFIHSQTTQLIERSVNNKDKKVNREK